MERVLGICADHVQSHKEAMRDEWRRQHTHLGVDPIAAISMTGRGAGACAGAYTGFQVGVAVGAAGGPPVATAGGGVGALIGAGCGYYMGKKVTDFTSDVYIFSRSEIIGFSHIWLRDHNPEAAARIRLAVQEIVSKPRKESDGESIVDDFIALIKRTWLPTREWQGNVRVFREARERLLQHCRNKHFEVETDPVCRVDNNFVERSYNRDEILSTLNERTGKLRCMVTEDEFRRDELRTNFGAVALLRCVEMNYLERLSEHPVFKSNSLNRELVRMAHDLSIADLDDSIRRETEYRRDKMQRVPLDSADLIEQEEAVIEVLATLPRILVERVSAQWQPV